MNRVAYVSIFFILLNSHYHAIVTKPTLHVSKNYAGRSYSTIKREFKETNAWGLHVTIDLKQCDPELIRSEKAIKHYVREIIKLIDMKQFGPTTVVHFGDDEQVAGYSMTQLIETSLISGHFANATNAAYLDIFSCKLFDPYLTAKFTSEFFKAQNYTLNVLFRK